MARHNELEQWKARLSVADRKFKPVEKKIDLAWDYYNNKQWGGGDGFETGPYKDQTIDNVIYQNIRAIIPRLNFRNPKIFTRPERKPFRTKDGIFDTVAASAYLEVVLNHYYRILNIRRESRRCLYDALLSPWGIMELGYTVKTEKVQDGKLLEVNELIMEDSPFCVRRDPKDFRQDPEGLDSSLGDSKWIALRWVKPLETVKKDPRYSNTSNLKANYRVKTDFNSPGNGTRDDEPGEDPAMWGRVEGWDIWNRQDNRICTIVKDHDRFLRNDKEWPLELDGFPVETIYFNENASDIYPIPDSWLAMPMQDELNRIGSLQLDHIRRISQRRYVSRENAFATEELRKLTHGGDGTIAVTSMNPEEAIKPLQDATISQDIYMIRNGIKQIIRQQMGVSDSEALQTNKYDQATEPALIEKSVSNIRGDQQATFENFVERIVRKLSKIIQQTIDEVEIPLSREQMNDKELVKLMNNKIAKISGVDGAIMLMPWLNISKSDLHHKDMDYIYEIEIGSTLPINEETQKRDAVALYKILEKNPYVKGREGTKEVLSAFNKQDPDKLLKTDQEVAQERMAQSQGQIQGEIAMDAPKRQVDLAKTQIKAQTTKEVAMMKAMSEHRSQEIGAENVQRQVHGSLLAEALKGKQQNNDRAAKEKENRD